jgi:palmitoyl-protein thioesterase
MTIDIFENQASIWYSLPWQLHMLNSRIEEIKYQKNFTQHHLLCHSQGALLCRAYVEEYSHNVESFLSLAGPQMGQFGATKYWEDYVPFLRNMTTHEAWKILYTPEIQMYISVAGYWNDPFHHTSFMRGCAFLPRFTYFNSDRYKYNFLRLKKAIFLGSRDDEVIEPYQSTLFGYWNITEKQDNYTIVPMEEQYMFKHNLFGLKTMRDRGKLFVHEHEGVWHVDWLSREDLFLKYMARHLY